MNNNEADPKRWKVIVPALFVFFYLQRDSGIIGCGRESITISVYFF